MKKWILKEQPPKEFFQSHPELPSIISRLLWNRNIKNQTEIDEFLNPDYSSDIHDPFIFSDMNKAVNLIIETINQKGKIVVHGDYDADGVCASAILMKTLKVIGAENTSVFIPHREEDGYGLNLNTADNFIKDQINLIITCDCGISNAEPIIKLKEAGIKTIITDHHAPKETLPEADAIIHAFKPDEKYPDKGLAGAGIAFKLAQALLIMHKEKNLTLMDTELSHKGFEKWLLDLVAIATIGDMVPLIGESRTLTRYGLTVLNKTKNIGLNQLFNIASITDDNGNYKRGKINAETVSFQIVPRLNAAGRMDHANTAFGLLMAEDIKTAKELAIQLNKNNIERQKMTEKYVNQAIKQITKTKQENEEAIFVYDDKWPSGLLGLISGRIKDYYHKPAFALTKIDNNIVGSARSVPGYNLVASWNNNPEIFLKFGGHSMAGGFTLATEKDIDILKNKTIGEIKKIENIDLTPQIPIDAEINIEDVDWKLYDLLQKFEPFGKDNEEPLYLANNLTIIAIEAVGQDGKHLKILVKHNTHLVKKTIAFGFGDCNKYPLNYKDSLKPGDKIDMVFSVSVNEWNGNRELQLTVKDLIKKTAD